MCDRQCAIGCWFVVAGVVRRRLVVIGGRSAVAGSREIAGWFVIAGVRSAGGVRLVLRFDQRLPKFPLVLVGLSGQFCDNREILECRNIADYCLRRHDFAQKAAHDFAAAGFG